MQIVINIPERMYLNAKADKLCGANILVNAIKNGITLPKVHGRLIDENELLKMTKSYKSELGRLKADPFVKCGIETVESFINDLPTIIEADRSEEE